MIENKKFAINQMINYVTWCWEPYPEIHTLAQGNEETQETWEKKLGQRCKTKI